MSLPILKYAELDMADVAGDMKVFAIYNRNYTCRYVLAADREAAILLARDHGHMRNPHHVRRINDVTEELLAAHDGAASLQELMAQAKPGVIQHVEGEGWTLASR